MEQRELFQGNTQNNQTGEGSGVGRPSNVDPDAWHKKGRNDKKLGGAQRWYPLGPAKWHFTVQKRYVLTTL